MDLRVPSDSEVVKNKFKFKKLSSIFSDIPQAPERGYFQSVEPGPNQTMPSGSGSGTLELIEVIRSQELEIHRQKKFNEKQYRQLTQQAQVCC